MAELEVPSLLESDLKGEAAPPVADKRSQLDEAPARIAVEVAATAQEAAWMSLVGDERGLADSGWFGEEGLVEISRSSEVSRSATSPHDMVFADLEDVDLS